MLRLAPENSLDILLTLESGDHHLAATLIAADAKIHARPQHGELITAAGVGLLHPQNIVDTDIHTAHPFLIRCTKLVYYYTPIRRILQRKERPGRKIPVRSFD